jgi:pimeloyl-ACP methyl ester carboxylesterase
MNRIFAYVAPAAVVGALLSLSCAGPAPFRSFRTADGFTIAADLLLPGAGSGDGPAPLVLLGHQLGRDRTSWDPLVPRLLDAGYAVVRLDHRGFGESVREVASGAELSNEQKSNLFFDYLGALEAVAGRPDVDTSRVAVVGTGLSVNAAVKTAVDRPEVRTLILLSGVIQKEEVLDLMDRPELPLLMIAASGDSRGAMVMRNYSGRFLGPAQRYVEFEPIDESDACNWEGTDGLTPETGLADLMMWFLEENFPAGR